MRVVLITGSEMRHRYYAQNVAASIKLNGLIVEKKRVQAPRQTNSDIVLQHFREREQKEQAWFGSAAEFEAHGCPLVKTTWGGSNSEEVHSFLEQVRPDYLLVYGTGIIGLDLIVKYPERLINCHLGLSPYYKGAATNFWPLVNGEPECVGATFHIIVPEVDAGPILHQIRPDDLSAGDDSHDIGMKVVEKASRIIAKVLREHVEGTSLRVIQREEGRLYKQKDFSEAAVVAMRKNFAEGMIAKYLADKETRDKRFPLVHGLHNAADH